MTISAASRLAQLWGFGRQPAKPKTTAPKAKPTPAPAKERETSLNARDLSPKDANRRLEQLGIDFRFEDRLAPPVDPAAQRIARRDLERAERRTERDQAKAIEAHTAEVNAGAIDARSASPEEVRARMASLGFETHQLSVHPVGEPLPPKQERQAGREQLEKDREVARAVHRAIQDGKRVDARKLTSGEFAALMQLRGAGL